MTLGFEVDMEKESIDWVSKPKAKESEKYSGHESFLYPFQELANGDSEKVEELVIKVLKGTEPSKEMFLNEAIAEELIAH